MTSKKLGELQPKIDALYMELESANLLLEKNKSDANQRLVDEIDKAIDELIDQQLALEEAADDLD
jgi:hypothetical protein